MQVKVRSTAFLSNEKKSFEPPTPLSNETSAPPNAIPYFYIVPLGLEFCFLLFFAFGFVLVMRLTSGVRGLVTFACGNALIRMFFFVCASLQCCLPGWILWCRHLCKYSLMCMMTMAYHWSQTYPILAYSSRGLAASALSVFRPGVGAKRKGKAIKSG